MHFFPDGSPHPDNPDPNTRVWSRGHRNPQGLALASNGNLYLSEHGPTIDDELNLIVKGGNYGWPNVIGNCDLPSEKFYCDEWNVIPPLANWTPTMAPAGLAYYDHEAIPEWKGTLLQTYLKDGKLRVIHLNETGDEVVNQFDYFVKYFLRLRDVLALPDGRVLFSTSNIEYTDVPRNPQDDKILELININDPRSAFNKKIQIELSENQEQIQINFNGLEEKCTVELVTFYNLAVFSAEVDAPTAPMVIDLQPEHAGYYFIKITFSNERYVIQKVEWKK